MVVIMGEAFKHREVDGPKRYRREWEERGEKFHFSGDSWGFVGVMEE